MNWDKFVYLMMFWLCWNLFALVVSISETEILEKKYDEEFCIIVYNKLICFLWTGPFIYIIWWDAKKFLRRVIGE